MSEICHINVDTLKSKLKTFKVNSNTINIENVDVDKEYSFEVNGQRFVFSFFTINVDIK